MFLIFFSQKYLTKRRFYAIIVTIREANIGYAALDRRKRYCKANHFTESKKTQSFKKHTKTQVKTQKNTKNKRKFSRGCGKNEKSAIINFIIASGCYRNDCTPSKPKCTQL